MKTAAVLTLLALPALLNGATDEAAIGNRLKQMGAAHPRIFLRQGGERALNESLAADPARAKLRTALLAQADTMLVSKPVERVLIGRRLLDKSRTCLSRVLHLGLAFRLTGERKYAERARQEMLAAAAFPDWNPSHFLDVAEMTAALGIGYDWLYPVLDEPSRLAIRQAIVEKGLKPSLTHNSWSKAIHNWNQVCNAGMAIGALAVAESEPQLAAQMIARAINTVPAAMHEYGPDGAYPEGPSYWSYGTTFNVMLIAALESTLGSDFELTRTPGFAATADYMLHVYGPTGLPFNYSDAGSGRAGLIPAMFWFASVRQAPYLLWSEWAKLAGQGNPFDGDRLDPLLLLWLPKSASRPAAPQSLSWTGHGTTPVSFHRSSWDPSATYVAIKGGSPSSNHAHMDAGAFVMDSAGTRWADDLGMQSYHSLESRGIDLWGRGQQAGRWKVFRLGTAAHNVLMVNGQQQRVDGMARITSSKQGRTVIDLSEIYRGQLAQARRGIQLRPDHTVLIQDEFAQGSEPSSVRWAMLTRADVRVDGPGRATLTRDGRTLEFRVLEPAGVVLKIYPTDPPPSETDAPNPGTRMVGFEIEAPAGAPRRVIVHLIPHPANASAVVMQPLSAW